MKKMTKTLAVGAALFMSAGVAQAANYEINVTGASAQFNFWNDMSKPFLMSAAVGCSDAQVSHALTIDGKRGFAKCNNGTNNYIIRYTSNASYDGITALQGTQDVDSCNAGAGTILRKYADDTATIDANGKIPNTSVVCKPTVLGASDVSATTFSQTSKGAKIGPMALAADKGVVTASDYMAGPKALVDASTAITKVYTDASATTPYTLTNNASHLAVPFAFYVNKGVTWKKCTAGAADKIGEFCQATGANEAECGLTSDATPVAGTCSSQTIDNLSRLQAILLFSGTVTNWGQFGNYFDAKPVIACLRHAGSGTHGTIDTAVMKSTWGKSLSNTAKNNYATNGNRQTYNVAGLTSGTSTTLNYIWFNNGSGDVKKCLDGQINDTTSGNVVQAARADLGIIGYMDADQPNGTNFVQIKYQGVKASRQALRNGWYDFYAMQNLYYNPSDTTNFTPVSNLITNAATGLIAFANNPANIYDGIGTSGINESLYWATKGELRFTKSGDTVYPTTKNGAVANAIPGAQTP